MPVCLSWFEFYWNLTVSAKFISQGLTDTKIGVSRFSPMATLRVPSQSELSNTYSQQSLHRSISQLIDKKSLMDEGSWDNPLGAESLVRILT